MAETETTGAAGTVTVRVSAGELRGTSAGGVDCYLGVPYAAAPLGALRFAPAAPHPGWEGVREATVMGPTAPQNPYGPSTAPLLANAIIPGDEFLNVNVWAPTGAHDRPVMVWVHGGSSAHGSNAVYDGEAFARDGVVFVGINYRLAVEGYSVLDDAPTNLGLSDVAAALRWVRAEIAAFGGDPARVTAFGESAGAFALSQLLASPIATELFDQVILQSGAPAASSRADAGKITQLTAKHLGVAPTREAFSAFTPDRLLEADAVITAKSNSLTGGPGYAAAIGDALVPRDPLDAVLDGAGSSIPVLMGWTSEEYRLFLVPSGIIDRVGRVLFTAARARLGITGKVLRAYRAAHPTASRGELLGEVLIDVLLRIPLSRLADARAARPGAAATYAYEFAWKSPVADLGAAHAMEIGFAFDRLESPEWIMLSGDHAPQQVADDMHAAWIRFAETGDPGWPAWDRARQVMVFDAPASGVQPLPRAAQLDALADAPKYRRPATRSRA